MTSAARQVVPDPREPYPEQAVGSRETQPPRAGPLQHVELVPQREHLEFEGGAGAHRTLYGQQQRNEDGDHRSSKRVPLRLAAGLA